MNAQELLEKGSGTTQEALEIFDNLPPVDLEFMKGRWHGGEVYTGHPMEGLLDYSGWYGKLFQSPEEVHPLLFYARKKTRLYAINPQLVPLSPKLPKIKALGWVMALIRPVVKTRKFRARMRMVTYRGKHTGAMVYDHRAIIDVFAKVDEDTMLGIMDLKGDNRPYVFYLRRDDSIFKIKY
ncbi:MAG: DUF4334 domain-containing protein [Bacteroidota bacterium]